MQVRGSQTVCINASPAPTGGLEAVLSVCSATPGSMEARAEELQLYDVRRTRSESRSLVNLRNGTRDDFRPVPP